LPGLFQKNILASFDDINSNVLKYKFLFSFLFFVAHFVAAGADKENSTFIYFKDQGNYFSLTEGGVPIPVIVDDLDFKGVHHAVGNLKEDFKRVTGNAPQQGAGKFHKICY